MSRACRGVGQAPIPAVSGLKSRAFPVNIESFDRLSRLSECYCGPRGGLDGHERVAMVLGKPGKPASGGPYRPICCVPPLARYTASICATRLAY